MLAAVLRGFNQLDLEDLPRPEPGPGEVLVRIKSCGFCATDYKAIKGIRRNVTFPLIPGHEPAELSLPLVHSSRTSKKATKFFSRPVAFADSAGTAGWG